MALAWIGLVLSLVALPCWYLIFTSLSAAITPLMVAPGPYFGPGDDLEQNLTSQLSDQMERFHQAASAYHRDFRKWPSDPNVLTGRYLRAGFALAEQLTYRPVPAAQSRSFAWILLVSDKLHSDPRWNAFLRKVGLPKIENPDPQLKP